MIIIYCFLGVCLYVCFGISLKEVSVAQGFVQTSICLVFWPIILIFFLVQALIEVLEKFWKLLFKL